MQGAYELPNHNLLPQDSYQALEYGTYDEFAELMLFMDYGSENYHQWWEELEAYGADSVLTLVRFLLAKGNGGPK